MSRKYLQYLKKQWYLNYNLFKNVQYKNVKTKGQIDIMHRGRNRNDF